MKFRIVCMCLALSLAHPVHAGEQKTEALKAGGAAAGGALVGGTVFATVGSAGIAIAGTGLALGAAPFIAAGAVVGLAGYGIYRVATEKDADDEVVAKSNAARITEQRRASTPKGPTK